MTASLDKLHDLSASIEQLLVEGNGRQVPHLLEEWDVLFHQVIDGGGLEKGERQRLIKDYTHRHERWLETAQLKQGETTQEIKRVTTLRKNRKLVDRIYEPAHSTGKVIRQSG